MAQVEALARLQYKARASAWREDVDIFGAPELLCAASAPQVSRGLCEVKMPEDGE